MPKFKTTEEKLDQLYAPQGGAKGFRKLLKDTKDMPPSEREVYIAYHFGRLSVTTIRRYMREMEEPNAV